MRDRAESPADPRHLTGMEKVPFLDYREVLVTGGTGFLGKAVCRALISRGYLPRLLVRIGSEGTIPDDIRRASPAARRGGGGRPRRILRLEGESGGDRSSVPPFLDRFPAERDLRPGRPVHRR